MSSVNLLREQVKVRLVDAPDSPKCYHNCEICVVRNGKGKRPEGYVPPPPEELAKLRKVPPKEEAEQGNGGEHTALSAALEAVFSATENYWAPQKPQNDGEKNENRGRRRGQSEAAGEAKSEGQQAARSEGKKPQRSQGAKPPRPPKPAKQVSQPEQKPAGPAPEGQTTPAEGEKKPRPHRRRRWRKPKSGGGENKASSE